MPVPYIGPAPASAPDVATKGYVDSAAGGSLVTTEIEVDFGTVTTRSKSFTITDATVTGASKILAFQSGTPATGRGKDDAAWDSITYAALPASGSFTLIGHASGRIKGKRKVIYTIS